MGRGAQEEEEEEKEGDHNHKRRRRTTITTGGGGGRAERADPWAGSGSVVIIFHGSGPANTDLINVMHLLGSYYISQG